MTPPTIDLAVIQDAATLKQRVAQALEAAGEAASAAQWRRETAGNDSLNGLVIKARAFVTVAPWLPHRQE